MRLMKLAGCNSMTVGIFAWAMLEPEEGRFDFSFLDKTMDDVYANGGRIVLATPSGARPAWLSQKYPEVLRVREDGGRNKHGRRHNHCFTSPIYREKVAIINRKLAERYANHPALVAWHLSNEYGDDLVFTIAFLAIILKCLSSIPILVKVSSKPKVLNKNSLVFSIESSATLFLSKFLSIPKTSVPYL